MLHIINPLHRVEYFFSDVIGEQPDSTPVLYKNGLIAEM